MWELQADGRRPEPASLPKQDKPAQGPGSPWRSHGSVATSGGVAQGAISSQIAVFDTRGAARSAPPRCSSWCGGLSDGDRGARLFQLRLDRVGLLLRHALL